MNKPDVSSNPASGNQSSVQRYSGVVVAPRPRYNAVSGRLRRYTSGTVQCSLFCGGSKCKYESETKWSARDVAVPGLYSHWITDKVLAMARPNTMLIKEKNLIGEFKQVGIQSLFNLQQPGEHKNCGPGLEESSGFSYRPEDLMSEGLFFYNYGWGDYDAPSIVNLLDMVKVFSFAVDQGNVAVHCHAGLGRTGVLIACYLIFSLHATADEAVAHMRNKRPGSVQSPVQLQIVEQFYHFLRPKWIVFPSLVDDVSPVTMEQFMTNQRCILHGADYRSFKYSAKIACDICGRVLDLCGVTTQFPWRTSLVASSNHSDSMLEELCKTLSELELRSYLGGMSSGSDHVISTDDVDDEKELELLLLSPTKSTSSHDNCNTTGCNETSTQSLNHDGIMQYEHHLGYWLHDASTIATVNKIKVDINTAQSTDYSSILCSITDITVLLCLLVNWLDELKEPLLSNDDISNVKQNRMVPLHQLGLVKEKAGTLQVLASTVRELANRISPADDIKQFVHHLSCSLIGCDRPAPPPIDAANKLKTHSDSSLFSHAHSRTLRHSSSMGVAGDNVVIYNLLLNQK